MNTNIPLVAVWTENHDALNEAETKAKQLGLEITNQADLLLMKSSKGWALSSLNKDYPGEIYIDFISGKNARRQKHPGIGKQPLAKAIGIKKSQRPTILDATAGLGGDAYLLATLGCKVWLCERDPIISTLLTDAINRAKTSQQTAQFFSNSMLFAGTTLDDAQQQLNHPPDVIYLDPMYPKPIKKRSANVKKDMQILRHLLSADVDANEWLEKARSWSKKVVVKRPSWAESLTKDVHGCVESKNHRYDIFLGKN